MPWKELPAKPSPPLANTELTRRGTLGRPILLTTNFFKVDIKKTNLSIYQYNVIIKNYKKLEVSLPKEHAMNVMEQMKKTYPRLFKDNLFAYDRKKIAYSVNLIQQFAKDSENYVREYEVDYTKEEQKPQKFYLTFEKTAFEHISSLLDAIKNGGLKNTSLMQMLEVFYRHNRQLKYNLVGQNSFFSPNGIMDVKPFDIEGGKQCVLGFFASLRPAQWTDPNGTLLMNVDVSYSAFFKPQNLIDYLYENFPRADVKRELDGYIVKTLSKDLKHIKIKVQHSTLKRTYKIVKICRQGPRQLKFPLKKEDGTEEPCTVEKYLRDQYKVKCNYPFLNCVHVGNPNRQIYIPMEFCEIMPGQKVKAKLSPNETAKFIRNTAVPPQQRQRYIQGIRQSLSGIDQPVNNALGFNVSDKLVQTKGRVLPDPILEMKKHNGDADIFPVRQGKWDVRNKKFFNGSKLDNWVLVNFDRRTNKQQIEKFVTMVVNIANSSGMSCEFPKEMINNSSTPDQVFHKLKTKHSSLNLVLCILNNEKSLYGEIKQAGDVVHGIVSQCVTGTNVYKCQDATVRNILLKINGKIGGVNNIVAQKFLNQTQLFNKPVLVMGADVNHPPAGDKNTPSFAAVLGSCDKNASVYLSECRHQKHRTEIIVEMQDITVRLLKGFREKTGCIPERIIMFRDGVSESQFEEVLKSELSAMRRACSSLNANYKPSITFLCVQKRHHTRLFCSEKDGVGKTRNIPAGTTVDQVITHPRERNFYLCSHEGIQGTSRPTHYHVLWDDSDLSMDQLQLLTYAMCHTYLRCTRSVSIPTPAYYAHLVAYRAKVHMCTKFDLMEAVSTNSSSSEDRELPDNEIARSIAINNNVPKSIPYFA